jgi:hypothetical protein
MTMLREPTLREICERRPRLLRVERVPARGKRSVLRAHALMLLFDRLQLSVRADPEAGALEVAASGAPMLEDALRADEDEPWWMLIGAPLVEAWQTSDENGASAALELQFREDASNPKVVTLRLARGHIVVRAHPKDVWLSQRDADAEDEPDAAD